jgi:hypothetical protein
MISVNGIVGLVLVVGALRHHLAVFNPEGAGSALATVITLASVTLVLPTFTTSQPGPGFSPSQLAFAAVASLARRRRRCRHRPDRGARARQAAQRRGAPGDPGGLPVPVGAALSLDPPMAAVASVTRRVRWQGAARGHTGGLSSDGDAASGPAW